MGINLGAFFGPLICGFVGEKVSWHLGFSLAGVGMTLGSGCGQRTLVRVGGGNLKSLVVVVVIALVAYYMANPFPGTDNTLYSMLFHDWIKPFAVELDGR